MRSSNVERSTVITSILKGNFRCITNGVCFIDATYNKNTNLFLENKMNSVVESLYYRPRPRKTRRARLFPDFPPPA